jgi:predicted nucleic acid-binding protein
VAKRRGLVGAIRPIVDDLINEAGFRVSSQLYTEVLAMADEDE